MVQADTILQDMGKEICASAERLTKRYDHAEHLMRCCKWCYGLSSWLSLKRYYPKCRATNSFERPALGNSRCY